MRSALEDEREMSFQLNASLEEAQEKNSDAAKAEKVVAKQLKSALDGVQVCNAV